MITNKHNLPEAFVRAVSYDDYDRGSSDVTASELSLPPRIFALRRKYPNEEVDASELTKILIGKAMHKVLEETNKEALIEDRLFTVVNGWTISGKFDTFTVFDGTLTDWKTTTVAAYTMKSRENFQEWLMQLNVYALLLRRNSYNVERIRIILFLTDYSPSKARRDAEYPPLGVQVVDLPLWPVAETEKIIHDRIELFKDALKNLPLCSDEDRWMRGGDAAVMKEGRKRAVKLFPSWAQAEEWIRKQNDAAALYIEERKKEYVRCLDFCPVRDVCTQWKDEH